MSEYTVEEQAANRAKWVEALRSGEYAQISGQLANDSGYCCLGVACEVAVAEGVIRDFDGDKGNLPRSVQDWLGLEQGNGPILDGEVRSLVLANDDYGFTFEDIANVIECGLVEVVQ